MKDTINIKTSGGIITNNFLDNIRQESSRHPALKPASFKLPWNKKAPNKRELDENIALLWEMLKEEWDKVSRNILSCDISTIRNKWINNLFAALDFNPVFQRKAIQIDEKLSFKLSHRGWDEEYFNTRAPVLHSVVPSQNLDEKHGVNRGAKSPHDLLQDYLNVHKDLWSLVTNGIYLRILRDFHHTYTRGYVEFDLYNIFEGRYFEDFRTLYRMVHASRFVFDDENLCPLEHFYKDSLSAGISVGKDLRGNVINAIEELGNGFLQGDIITELQNNEEKILQFYRELLIVVYRIIFLLFAEQRGMMPGRNSLYAEEYSISQLRERASQDISLREDHRDLWEGLRVTFDMAHKGVNEPGVLEIFGYNGKLFNPGSTELINSLECFNSSLLKSIRYLTFIEKDKVLSRISYSDLGVEEIGSIYESLLDFIPRVASADEIINNRKIFPGNFFLDPRGSSRKTTGSYYTPPSLVNELIKSALVSVLQERLDETSECFEKDIDNDENIKILEKALLSIKVCDPACGSGAFLIAANNYLAKELAKIRTGIDSPSDDTIAKARRDVLQHCIYGVDKNSMAVELAKVSLWINACVKDKPLTFLDHHIKCGDSLIGATPELIKEGPPDKAFEPVEGDDKENARNYKKFNKKEREEFTAGQLRLQFPEEAPKLGNLLEEMGKLEDFDEETANDIREKEKRYEELVKSLKYTKLTYDAWCAAFFWKFEKDINNIITPPTFYQFKRLEQSPFSVSKDIKDEIQRLAKEYNFFHWHLEFPGVFNRKEAGFDVVLGNPPWERIKLQEKEFFAAVEPEIANASKASVRKNLIFNLKEKNLKLFQLFLIERRKKECYSKFLRLSNKYPLSAVGDINTYQIFADISKNIISGIGRAGIIVPIGIATTDTMKVFFGDIVEKSILVSLYDFENRENLFPAVDSRMKFCLFTLSGFEKKIAEANFSFFLKNIEELKDEERRFVLSPEDFKLLNPNTRTCPIFRTNKDAELTKYVYKQVPVLHNEIKDENLWDISFMTMFHMTNDSEFFYEDPDEEKIPLYEAKMFWHFDHRFGTYEGVTSRASTHLPTPTTNDYKKPHFFIKPWYWVYSEEVEKRFGGWKSKWVVGFRDITNNTNERTAIFSILPRTGFSNKVPLILFKDDMNLKYILSFIGNVNSFIFDYVARQKIGGTSMNFFILKQLPVIPPNFYTNNNVKFVFSRAFELIYTAYDLKPFAEDCGYSGEPFTWDEERRFMLRAQLDAFYFHLYKIKREDVDYIMETFPITKRKDIDKYGTYKTKEEILKCYDEYDGKIEEIEL